MIDTVPSSLAKAHMIFVCVLIVNIIIRFMYIFTLKKWIRSMFHYNNSCARPLHDLINPHVEFLSFYYFQVVLNGPRLHRVITEDHMMQIKTDLQFIVNSAFGMRLFLLT